MMGMMTEILLDKLKLDTKHIKYFFMAFLIYLDLNLMGITDNIPILDGLRVSALSSGYSWIYGIIITIFIFVLYEDTL